MNKERLQMLIDFLKELPDKQFDIRTFGNVDEDDPVCGTAACVAGWASILAAGVQYDNDPEKWISTPIYTSNAGVWLGLLDEGHDAIPAFEEEWQKFHDICHTYRVGFSKADQMAAMEDGGLEEQISNSPPVSRELAIRKLEALRDGLEIPLE